MTLLKDVRFDALRNANYHRARQRVLEQVNKVFNTFIILLGASVASELLKLSSHPERASIIGFATVLVATIQMIYDPGGRAKSHEFLQRRFYEVLACIQEGGESPTQEQIDRWEADLIRIYADQPPTMRALDSIAWNESADSFGVPRAERLHVSLIQSLLRHVFAFNNTYFKTEQEFSAGRKPWFFQR